LRYLEVAHTSTCDARFVMGGLKMNGLSRNSACKAVTLILHITRNTGRKLQRPVGWRWSDSNGPAELLKGPCREPVIPHHGGLTSKECGAPHRMLAIERCCADNATGPTFVRTGRRSPVPRTDRRIFDTMADPVFPIDCRLRVQTCGNGTVLNQNWTTNPVVSVMAMLVRRAKPA
jgi:hypothetical protein